MFDEKTNAKGPLLTRELGEDKVPIFFDVKEIKGAMEAGDTMAVLPGIIRNNGQPLPGSWYLVEKEILQEIKRLMDNLHREDNFQDEDYWELLNKLEIMVIKALKS